MTSVAGHGDAGSLAEGKALTLEQLLAPCYPCWEAGLSVPAHLAPRYKALSCVLQLIYSTQSCDCHRPEPHIAPPGSLQLSPHTPQSSTRTCSLFLLLSPSPLSAQQSPAPTAHEARAHPHTKKAWGGLRFRLAVVLWRDTCLGLGNEKQTGFYVHSSPSPT